MHGVGPRWGFWRPGRALCVKESFSQIAKEMLAEGAPGVLGVGKKNTGVSASLATVASGGRGPGAGCMRGGSPDNGTKKKISPQHQH